MTDQSKIYLSPPHMGGEEMEFIQQAFHTNWIAPLGANVDGLEKDLADFTGVGNVAALSSGTAAIHLSLKLLGVEAGDEVLCQSFTFSASANPICYLNATPIFIDSEKETWNLDPVLLEEAIIDRISKGKKPKAIIPVHLYGMPAKMKEILAIASKYKIPVIEDAAEALGSEFNGKPCGSFGKIGILSFNGNKIITTSGGGAFLSSEKDLVEKARFLATQARDNYPHYQHSHIGYNYRMSNVLAGIGRGQMKVLKERVERRRYNFEFYRNELSEFKGITFLDEPEGCYSNRWLTCVLINPEETGGITREDIRLALDADQIESRPLWKPMHSQPIFKDAPFYGNGVSENLFENGLCLPSGSALSDSDLERIISIVKKTLQKAASGSFASNKM